MPFNLFLLEDLIAGAPSDYMPRKRAQLRGMSASSLRSAFQKIKDRQRHLSQGNLGKDC